jgi:hypothetical protein
MKYSLVVCLLCLLCLYGCQETQTDEVQNAVVSFLLGDVQVNGKTAQLNQEIQNGMDIVTGEKSRAEIKVGQSSGIQIRENSQVKLLLEHNEWKTEVKHGAVLNLLRPRSKYQLHGPAGVIAVRGTIFYVNCYEDGTQYVCTCNGTVDILVGDNMLQEVSSSHHEPYTLIPTAHGTVLNPSEMKEHNDAEIFEFMYRMERGTK